MPAESTGDYRRLAELTEQAAMLERRFRRTGAVADIDEAIRLLRAAARTPALDGPTQALVYNNLSVVLQARFERNPLGKDADLDEAIAASQKSVTEEPADSPGWPVYAYGLGVLLSIRFGSRGDLADANGAVKALSDAIGHPHAQAPDRAAWQSSLSGVLLARYQFTTDETDLDEAVSASVAAVEAIPADHPNRAAYLSNLATIQLARYEHTQAPADLEKAVTAARHAVAATLAHDPKRAVRLTNLGAVLLRQASDTRLPAHQDEAIDTCGRALAAFPAGHPDRAAAWHNLGTAYRRRYDRTRATDDLDGAVHALRSVMSVLPAHHARQPVVALGLAGALRLRFAQTGTLADLEEAISALQVAAAVPRPGPPHPDLAGVLMELGTALRTRFDGTGALSDLDAAIAVGERAVAAFTTPERRVAALTNLGNALLERFVRMGALADVDAAVSYHQRAIDAIPADDPRRATVVHNLGDALRSRYARTGSFADLEAAEHAGEQAVAAASNDHPYRAQRLAQLGGTLLTLYRHTGDPARLDAAIDTVRSSAQAGAPDQPRRVNASLMLAEALRERFDRTGAPADLDAAIGAAWEAVDATPDGHSQRASYLVTLGAALRKRYESGGSTDDLNAAVSSYTEAYRSTASAPSDRIAAAGAAAELLADTDAAAAADAAETAVRLLTELAPRRLGRSDQQHALGRFAGLAAGAAALALAAPDGTGRERAARALRLLEAGRAVLISQALETHGDLAELRRRHPALAARFVELRELLERPPQPPTTIDIADGEDAGPARGTQPQHPVLDRHRTSRQFNAILAEIRAKDGFATFGLPPATGELLAEAAEGAIVVFNASRYRSDALLLTRDGISAVPLPELAFDALVDRINDFFQALNQAVSNTSRAERVRAQARLSRILEWLWDAAMEPVLTALGHDRPRTDGHWPRVWLVPGGMLGLLPLHAAGYHDEPHGRAVIDRVICSYTPTIQALRHARQQASTLPPRPTRAALVVGMPTTPDLPGGGRLAHVLAETTALRERLPNQILLLEPAQEVSHDAATPSPAAPTKGNVLRYLSRCQIAHFACHATIDTTDPSESRLLLHDHATDPLTVASLVPAVFEHSELAYLSACSTASTPAQDLADEAIHLASAFQIAGFPHVIGTLWEIDDRIAVIVAISFYEKLRPEPQRLDLDPAHAAHALHSAVREARDRLPHTPSLWAAYLHVGA